MPPTRRPKRTAGTRPAPTPPAPPAEARPTRPWVTAAALAGLHLVLCAISFNPGPHVGGDNAIYVSLAEALLSGRGYVEIWDPAAAAHGQYPPIFPLIVAGGMLLGLKPWVGLKVMMVAMSGLCVALTYLWLRRAATPRIALAVGLLTAAAPGVAALSFWVLSDGPFWLFTTLALWAAAHVEPASGSPDDQRERPSREWTWLAAAGVAVLLAFFTRSAGLPLVLAFGVWLLVRRRWIAAGAFAVATAIPTALWTIYVRGTGAPSYGEAFLMVDPYRPEMGKAGALEVLSRMAPNLGRYLATHLPELLLGTTGAWATVVASVVALLALAGWAMQARRGTLPGLLLPPYMGLLLVWPITWSAERFLLPVVPLLLWFAAEGALWLAGRAKLPAWSAAAAAGLLLLMGLPGTAEDAQLGAVCRADARAGRTAPCRGQQWEDLFGVARDARAVLPPGAAVFSRKPSLVYVFSGHPGRLYPMSLNPDDFFREARAAGIEYLIADRVPDLAPLYLNPVLIQRRDRLCMMRAQNRPFGVLFRIIRPGFVNRDDLPEGGFRFCDVLPPEAFETPPRPTR